MVAPNKDAELAREAARLAALQDYGILDTGSDPAFDDIVLLASRICGTPTALVSLVGSDRQWFKAKVGFENSETPISQSVCSNVLEGPDILVIPDLSADARTKTNLLVTGAPHIRFYAGARIKTPGGFGLGALCVIDTLPRSKGLTASQTDALRALARQVMQQIEFRRMMRQLDSQATQTND